VQSVQLPELTNADPCNFPRVEGGDHKRRNAAKYVNAGEA